MTGASEILILILLILSVLFIPRLLGSGSERKSNPLNPFKKTSDLGVLTRAGIILTLLYPSGVALYLKPWEEQNLIRFIVLGLFPVLLSWSVVWIVSGRKN